MWDPTCGCHKHTPISTTTHHSGEEEIGMQVQGEWRGRDKRVGKTRTPMVSQNEGWGVKSNAKEREEEGQCPSAHPTKQAGRGNIIIIPR